MHFIRKERPQAAFSPIAEEVRRGLSAHPKWLPSHLFYDERGSQLFEQITGLPEYYITRTERDILEKHASAMIDAAGHGLTLIELGAGTAAKTEVLLAALMRKQLSATFYPVDVSPAALMVAERNLAARFPALRVRSIVTDYTLGLPELAKIKGRKLVLYIGSSIGNFEPHEASDVLRKLRGGMERGDAMLLGTDLVKDERLLLDAYNDFQGVTAAFNLNLLQRINEELQADFDLEGFRHEAVWNPKDSRIEMHLFSQGNQRVHVRSLDESFDFAAGESIHTENSYKFAPELLRRVLSDGGFVLEKSWMDQRKWFGVHLARVI